MSKILKNLPDCLGSAIDELGKSNDSVETVNDISFVIWEQESTDEHIFTDKHDVTVVARVGTRVMIVSDKAMKESIIYHNMVKVHKTKDKNAVNRLIEKERAFDPVGFFSSDKA